MKYIGKMLCLMAVVVFAALGTLGVYAQESSLENNPSYDEQGSDIIDGADDNGDENLPSSDEQPDETEIVLSAVMNITQTSRNTSSVTLSWDLCENAEKYEIYLLNKSTGKYELNQTSADNTAVISGLSAAMVYKIQICASAQSGEETVRSDFSRLEICTAPEKVTGLATEERSPVSIRFHWNSLSNVNGYDIFLYDSKTGEYVYRQSSALTVSSVKSLISGTDYQVGVRAYKLHNGEKVYGEMATCKSFTKASKGSGLTVTSRTTSGYTLKWNSTRGASGYDVLIYNSTKKAYVLYKSNVMSTSLKITGLKEGAVALYEVRPYIMYNGKKITSTASSPVRAVTQVKSVKLSKINYLNGVKLSWTKNSAATGYKIYYKSSKTASYKLLKTYTTNSTLSLKVNNLTGGNTYYFKIVPYKKSNNKVFDGVATEITATPYKDNLNSILTSYKGSKSVTVTNSKFKLSTSRKNAIMKLINNYSDTCGFVMLDIKSGGMVAYNADWYVPTASTVKAPYICYVLSQEIDKGKAKLSELLTYQKKHYKTGSGVIQYAALGTKYSIQNVIEKILYYSDNTGYYMLQDRFGVTNYNKWLKSLGCRTFINGTTTKWGYVSARDSAKIWVEIYRYIYSGKYGDFFKNELLTTGYSPIRDVLGSKYNVANKFGGADPGWHDTGIVFSGDNPYILILLTNDSYLHPNTYFQQSMIKQLDAVHDEMVAFNKKNS